MFKDARGQGDYDIFPAVRKGQINISKTYPGVIRAFHRHLKQDDYWYIVSGQFEVALCDEQSNEAGELLELKYLGPGDSLRIKPPLWHGFRVLGTEVGILLYYVTNNYDPENPDEERAEWDTFYDWKTRFK